MDPLALLYFLYLSKLNVNDFYENLFNNNFSRILIKRIVYKFLLNIDKCFFAIIPTLLAIRTQKFLNTQWNEQSFRYSNFDLRDNIWTNAKTRYIERGSSILLHNDLCKFIVFAIFELLSRFPSSTERPRQVAPSVLITAYSIFENWYLFFKVI